MTVLEKDAPAVMSDVDTTNLLVSQLKDSGALDALFEKIDSGQVALTGDGGLVPALIKAALERGLQAEMSAHLGYENGDRGGKAVAGALNHRNGAYPKQVDSEVGPIEVMVPRDREGSFTPRLVPKGSRRLGGLDDMIISLYAGGMTVREIQWHLQQTVGTELSAQTISNITDAVLEAVMEWQRRPLEEFYPIIYMDAIRVKIRDGGKVVNKAAHMAVGVDLEGIKNVLGIWVQPTEGASFWAGVCADLANRGVREVLIVATDGLKGFPEAIEATWPGAIVQTCVVHLIRASMRFVPYKDRKAVSAALKPIYQAVDEDGALAALDAFANSPLGKRYPAAVKTWEDAWERFIPFLQFPPQVRKIIYTTNAIESLNYQMRKVTKSRGQFPTDMAAVKMLWLAICNIEDKRAAERAKERGKKGARTAQGALIQGQKTQAWNQALAQLIAHYPDRFEPYL